MPHCAPYSRRTPTAGSVLCKNPRCPRDRFFETETSLREHYRGSREDLHPNCPVCGLGFFDKPAVAEHKKAHPKLSCKNSACRIHGVYERDLRAHYEKSPARHVSCPICVRKFRKPDCPVLNKSVGYFDVEELQTHYEKDHDDLFCSACKVLFDSTNLHFEHSCPSSVNIDLEKSGGGVDREDDWVFPAKPSNENYYDVVALISPAPAPAPGLEASSRVMSLPLPVPSSSGADWPDFGRAPPRPQLVRCHECGQEHTALLTFVFRSGWRVCFLCVQEVFNARKSSYGMMF